jgi:Doubled CXXCH motif (Paired_CXXCH_1)
VPTGEEQADLTDQCLTCHSQHYLGSVESDGATKDLYIDPEAYGSSAHNLLPCNACHIGFSHDPHQMVSNGEFFAQTAREACRNCHDDQFEMYKQSYHGALSRGGTAAGERAPECVDCHGTHAIQKVNTLEYKQSIQDVCGKCHGGRESSFLDSYHGKAVTLGRENAATCVDCHGDHSILPVSNPESKLSKENVLSTCQECHPDASQGFTTFLVHVKPTSSKAPLLIFAVSIFYLLLIVSVFAFGGIHTLLYIYRGLKDGMYFGKGGGH